MYITAPVYFKGLFNVGYNKCLWEFGINSVTLSFIKMYVFHCLFWFYIYVSYEGVHIKDSNMQNQMDILIFLLSIYLRNANCSLY